MWSMGTIFSTMTLELKVLGIPGGDNALFVRINSGQTLHRLLFDCGEGCLRSLPISEIQQIDHVFFSHLHVDHVAGFDSFFRCRYFRDSKPNVIWGPPETSRIMHHRFQGFMWNLHETLYSSWRVYDIHPDKVVQTRFEAQDGFRHAYRGSSDERNAVILRESTYHVEAYTLDHRTPCLAYIVREAPRINVNTERLAALGLTPGPWLQQLKTASNASSSIMVNGVPYHVGWLKEQLLVQRPGESVAYLTDFLLDDEAEKQLICALRGCTTMVCESQYLEIDRELATRNYHLTARQAARLARRSGVRELILFHVSVRYGPYGWKALLDEAKAEFPNTRFPVNWPN